jgi:putative tricarboxylic transport membrane protein
MVTTDRVAGAALALLALFVLVESRTLPLGTLTNPGPAYFPVVLAVLLLALGLLIVALGGRASRMSAIGWSEWHHVVAISVVIAVAAYGLERAGYRVTVAVLVFLLLALVERKGWLLALVFAVSLSLATFYLFDTLLRVPLPRGPQGF